MGINVRNKGQEGEREIAKMLNAIVAKVRKQKGLPQYAVQDELFQRNQNQSAVGGSDLSSPMPLEIEIKRQETLSVNSWWKQCVASAKRTKGIPILIYRQNRKPWRVVVFAEVPLLPESDSRYLALPQCQAEVTIETFKTWFTLYYQEWLRAN